MWTYNEAAIELTAAVIVKLIQQHGLEFRDGIEPLAKKRFRIRLDSILYLS